MILLSYNISMDNENKIKFLEEENSKLKLELEKYKNSHKSYYEKNKKNIMEKANERLQSDNRLDWLLPDVHMQHS